MVNELCTQTQALLVTSSDTLSLYESKNSYLYRTIHRLYNWWFYPRTLGRFSFLALSCFTFRCWRNSGYCCWIQTYFLKKFLLKKLYLSRTEKFSNKKSYYHRKNTSKYHANNRCSFSCSTNVRT